MVKSRNSRPFGCEPSHALALAIVAGGLASLAGPAAAQDGEEIVVTGSRIRTDPLTNRQPVTQLGGDDIARTGLSSVADVLQRLPISGGGLNTRNNNSGNIGSPPDGGGVGAGSAEVDLRFLSPRRVLVLVDGLRWVNGAAASGIPGSVDLNTIPSAMIDRIEVLQESASPIYGSDAIAGVVNIITRRHQEGLQISAQRGGYWEQGDGEVEDYSLSYGLNPSESTSIVLGANYASQAVVSSGDRALSASPAPYASNCDAGGCSSGTPNGRIDVVDPNTGESLDLTVGAPGQTPLYDPLNPHVVSGSNTFRDWAGTPDRFNFAPYNYLQTPSERWGAFAQITQDFDNGVSLRVRGSFAERTSANQAAPLPLFLGPSAGNGTPLDDTIIDETNPYNPFGFTLSPAAGTYSFIGRRMVEAGPRHFEQTVDTWNLTATLSGQWALFGHDWYWDANAVSSTNTAAQSFTGNINLARVQQALGPLADCTGECVPLNVFGGAGAITQEMLNFIGFTEHNSSEQELHDLSFNFTGDIVDLPAGALAFAGGVEHRAVKGSFDPDPITAAGLSSDIPALPSGGEFDVDEAYGELRIPLAADAPLFHQLEATLAARYFNYSTFGADATYQAGLHWRPVENLLLRGSWGQGFRAPSIGELYGSASRFDQTIVDPCTDLNGTTAVADGGRGVGNPAPADLVANCVAHGVPVSGSYIQPNPQLPVFTTGNAALEPETSESFNLGVVWRPAWLSGLAFSDDVTFEVNYADIKIDQAIQARDSQAVLDLCETTNSAAACSTVNRAITGAVRGITNPLLNVGGINTRALDFNIRWTSPEWPIGRFSVQSNTSHLLEYTEFVAVGETVAARSREGAERGSPAQAFPEWKSTTTLGWDLGNFGASLTNRYVSSLIETNNGGSVLDSVNYWDTQLRWSPARVNDRITLAIGVNNLLDEETPGCSSCDVNNMDPSVHDVPGRFGYVRVAFRQ